MSEFLTFISDGVRKGINPMLITHFEEKPQGGALVNMMGGTAVPIDKGAWDVVGKKLAPASEPSPAAGAQV